MQLSPHVTLAEMTRTGRPGYDHEQAEGAAAVLDALRATAAMLEVVRGHFGRAIIIHSGYRCPELNAAVDGSVTSQHMRGEAADFHVAGVQLEDVWAWVRDHSGLAYGQCLLEPAHGEPRWVHLSLGEPWRPREKSRQAFRTG